MPTKKSKLNSPPYAKQPELIDGRWCDGEYWFDEQAAVDATGFIETLRHIKAEWAGSQLRLQKWQRDIIRAAFGWKRKDNTRRYRIVYVEIPRKNGKSTLAAGVGLKLLYADGERGAEVYSAAAERKQAGIVFDTAKQMVIHDDDLAVESQVFRDSVYVPATGSAYQVLSADAETKHGLNASGVIFDELHVQPNRRLWDTLRTSMGSRQQPLLWSMTTAGWDRNSICYQVHDHAIQVRDGALEDDEFLPVIYAAAQGDADHAGDDWTEERTWKKANPNYGISIKPEFLKGECNRALSDPELENTFKRLQLNIWTEQSVRWMPMLHWNACAEPAIKEADLVGRLCYGGLDLADNDDIAAWVLLFPPAGADQLYRVLCRFFCPSEAVRGPSSRAMRDRLPYTTWVSRGYMTETQGNVIDYDVILEKIKSDGQKFRVAGIGVDPWNARHMITMLDKAGFHVEEFRQGYRSMNEPTKLLKKTVSSRRLAHGGNPILRWMASNVAVRTDPAANVKPDKEHSQQKIDGIVALIMALGLTIGANQGSVYDTRGVRIIGERKNEDSAPTPRGTV